MGEEGEEGGQERAGKGAGRDREGGRERKKGSEGIEGKGRDGKDNGDRPPTIFDLKVVLVTVIMSRSETANATKLRGLGHRPTGL